MPGQVTMIPATRDVYTGIPTESRTKRRVAAYARVSTDSDEQQTSYDAQVDHYTRYIKNNPEWKYAGTYADEGISGTMTKNRAQFNQMIDDALTGKIDLIITKSVSRFARNTVDSLTTIRKLKENGVEVYFEKENIYTFDSKGELLLTLMSSLAQEESRSLSQNVTWGHRKRFADGKVTIHYENFLGYRKGADGKPEIDPEEAKVIRRIYREFICGASYSSIATGLTEDGILTPRGSNKWSTSTIQSILKNEKYKGDALLQKSFTQDFLTKKQKINEGEVPQYYVTGSHPAIIKPDEWDLVQLEINNRKRSSGHYTSKIFNGKIICGDCGSSYGAKVWHSNDPYRTVIWQCNDKFKGKKCGTRHLQEEQIKELFIQAYSKFVTDLTQIISDLNMLIDSCLDTASLESKVEQIITDLELLYSAMKQCVSDNASALISEADYKSKYSELYERYEKLSSEKAKLEEKITTTKQEAAKLKDIILTLETAEQIPMVYDNTLFNSVIDKVVVKHDDTITFCFVGGKEYEFEI